MPALPKSPVFRTALDLALALRLLPDPIQADLLRQNPLRCIINCSRQWGKSTITALKTMHHALTRKNSLTLVLTPSARQSAEFLRKIKIFLLDLGISVKGDGHNEMSLLLPNHSRVVGLPGKEETTRGFSGVSLLIVDEASRVDDNLYHSVRPAIATDPNANIWILSTPNGRRGFFYETFTATDAGPGRAWKRVRVPAEQCPRITPQYLAEERASMTERLFRQEYCCEFVDSDDAVFPSDLLHSALCDVPALTVGIRRLCIVPDFDLTKYEAPPHFYIGLDLGQSHDYTAISILERASIITSDRPDPVFYNRPTEIRYTVRHLERLPLGKTYPDIVRHVCDLVRHPSLCGRKTLVVDTTGIGKPVLDLLRREHPSAILCPVILTGGELPSFDGSIHRVPRRDLLTSLQVFLQSGLLKIGRTLPAAETLIHELASLRHSADRIDTEKSTQHDDLAFATALAVWKATLRR